MNGNEQQYEVIVKQGAKIGGIAVAKKEKYDSSAFCATNEPGGKVKPGDLLDFDEISEQAGDLYECVVAAGADECDEAHDAIAEACIWLVGAIAQDIADGKQEAKAGDVAEFASLLGFTVLSFYGRHWENRLARLMAELPDEVRAQIDRNTAKLKKKTDERLKAELLALAKAGAPKPEPGTELGDALVRFTTPPESTN